MKKKLQIAVILAAMICMSISGCNEKDVTPISTSVTEPIAKISVTTVTSAEEVLDTTAISSTAVWTETVTEAVVAVLPKQKHRRLRLKHPSFMKRQNLRRLLQNPLLLPTILSLPTNSSLLKKICKGLHPS